MRKLIGVTLLSGLLTFLRMISGFIIAKFVALYAGPSGIAMLGQVQNLVTALNGVVSAPAGNGVVRYTAENIQNSVDDCAPWWKAALAWIFLCLAIAIPIICIASPIISNWLLKSEEYKWLVVVAAILLPLSAVNILFTSILNGLQDYRRYISIGAISTIVATVLVVIAIVYYKIYGALLSAVFFPAISGLIMCLAVANQSWFRYKYWFGKINSKQFIAIGKYVAMAAASAVLLPLGLVYIRDLLVRNVGWVEAGYWQSVYKISEVYLAVITIALSTYYLPRLSSISDAKKLKLEVVSVAKIVIPIVSLLALLVYFLRDFAISLLFTKDFYLARDFFAIQLLGDVVKIFAWIFAYPMLSRGAATAFILSEIIFTLILCALASALIPVYGVHGANYAYIGNYILYSAFVLFYFRKIK